LVATVVYAIAKVYRFVDRELELILAQEKVRERQLPAKRKHSRRSNYFIEILSKG
jgi:hypothetical protein